MVLMLWVVSQKLVLMLFAFSHIMHTFKAKCERGYDCCLGVLCGLTFTLVALWRNLRWNKWDGNHFGGHEFTVPAI